MIEIEINNSYSQVKGMTPEIYRELRKVLSYSPPAAQAYYSRFKSRPTYLIDTKGFFPTGLLSLVAGHLGMLGPDVNVVDSRKVAIARCGHLRATFKDAHYPAQLKATTEAFLQDRGIISMPTGTGKSRVIAKIIDDFKMRTLIVVPNLSIKEQLSADLNDIFGSLKDITVENIDSAKLKTAKNYDILIIDEAHHVAAKTYQKLNKTVWTGIFHRFFLTATPFRSQAEEQILFQAIAGDVIYELSYREAIKEGYIAPVEAFYYDIPKTKNDFYSWPEVYSNLVVNHEHRNNVIAFLMAKLHNSKQTTLCLVKEIKHGENLVKLTNFDFANGQDDETRPLIDQFKKGKLQTLIGTNGIVGEGVDTKPCEYVIIAGLGKAKSAFMQQIGRAVRKYPGKESAKVIIFRDASHKFLLSHFKAQCAILKEEYGVVPTKLEL